MTESGTVGTVREPIDWLGAALTTGGIDRYNPGIGRPLRLAGRRLDAVRIHRESRDRAQP
jgi:hypothetical protein